ncbi:MAG: hypothetical protein R2824_29930 [Saprospiraceae bacterium]
MKKTITLLLFITISCFLVAQNYTAKIPGTGQWKSNELLTFSSFDGQSKIVMMTLAKKVQKNDHSIKHLKIDGTAYQLIRLADAINLTDAAGHILLKTNAGRTEVFSAKNEKFTKIKTNRQLQYRDVDNQVIVGGIIHRGQIFVKNYGTQAHPMLTVLCMEELLQQEHQRQKNDGLIPIISSSLLND